MNFMATITTCFAKYATFEGRARRSEYWYWVIFGNIVGLLSHWSIILNMIIGLICFMPGLAVMVRRLHDTGRSGWWSLLVVIPTYILLIYLFYILDSVLFGRKIELEDLAKLQNSVIPIILLSVIVLVNNIIMIIFCCQDSQPGANEYGANPKELA